MTFRKLGKNRSFADYISPCSRRYTSRPIDLRTIFSPFSRRLPRIAVFEEEEAYIACRAWQMVDFRNLDRSGGVIDRSGFSV